MGKKAEKAPDEAKTEKKKTEKEPENAGKKKVKPAEAANNTESPEANLAAIKRVKARCILLPCFLLACGWLILTSSPCKVKKRVDCGWSGISNLMCQTGACLMKEGATDTKTIVVKRESGAKSGVKLALTDGSKVGIVKSIKGAVADHNAQFPIEALHVGDRVVKVDGQTGSKMSSALSNAALDTITIEVVTPVSGSLASYYPGFLQRMDNNVAISLKSPAFEKWSKFFGYIGGMGFFSWALSGYPAASLPLWYFTSAAFTSYWLTGCCMNDKPKKQGDPHCYMSGVPDEFGQVILQAVERSNMKYFQSIFK